MPDLGGAENVDVIEVLMKVGDQVKVDTPLLTLESDKATMDLPSSDEGVIKEIKVKVGDKISVGQTIATIESDGTSAAVMPAKTHTLSTDSEKSSTTPTETHTPSGTDSKASPVTVAGASTQNHPDSEKSTQLSSTTAELHAGPAVRKIAREFGVDLSQVKPSGPKDRIIMEDIQAYVKSRLSGATTVGSGLPTQPVVDFTKFGLIETQPLTKVKKLTGKNLHRNWLLVPHVTQFGEADITDLEDFRNSQKSYFEKQGIKLTPLAFIMKAVVVSLKTFPQFNSSLDASQENLILKKYFHIGVAVDTPEGLVVPVIRDADKKGLGELAKELSIVSEKARNKQLTPADMQGGTFSISSLGGIGGTAFTPIINCPEVAILGVSKSSYKPVYQGQFIPRLMLPLSLSYDHRVIDGADGARFIVHLTQVLSDIRNLLL